MSELLNVYADMPFPTRTQTGQARDAALQASAAVEVEATSLVNYRSAGYLLIIGNEQAAMAAAKRVEGILHCTVVVTDSNGNANYSQVQKEGSAALAIFHGQVDSLNGHLGRFVATLQTSQGESLNLSELNGTQHPSFDLVLDLQKEPLLGAQVPPFGYYPAGSDQARLERALAEIPEMTGEFDKPKFFNYSPDICAHGDSGLTGCTRCLDTCPTDAIKSAGDHIEVDPYLCQGGGSCAAACPTGAIIYAYPQPRDQITRIREMLKAYREMGGENPLVLFHDDELGVDRLRESVADLPERVIPVRVAEVGSVGMDVWLSALAYGASQVVLLDTDAVPASVRSELDDQISYVRALLEAMNYELERVVRLGTEYGSVAEYLSRQPDLAPVRPAGFDTFNEKRGTLRLALDHLYDQASSPATVAAMPAGAPFGQVLVDQDKCTLCMSCVQVCPARALTDGSDKPQLNFTEDLCVQCGLCQTACPEQAISLEGRFLFDWEQRRKPRVVNEEAPLHCISCDKPFATASVVERMIERLQGHSMFKTEADLRRLKMCADCRVMDVFSDDMQDVRKPKVFE